MTSFACWTLWCVLTLSGLGLSAANQCSTWTGHHHRFGPACELQCHCWDRGEQCDRETGECARTGCAGDWMGPGCQYKNKAVEADVDANYGSSLTLAVDGNRETCSSQSVAATDPFVRIALPFEMNIAEVSIRFKNYTQAMGFSVYAGLSTTRDQRTLCGGDQEARVTDHVTSVTCGRHLAARFVTVLLPGKMKRLEICEIRVPQGRHLSYLAPMSGSSQDRNLDDLVNGRTDDHGSTQEEESPWITVDLQREYHISLIELKNKEDVRRDLLGFELYVSRLRDFSDGELVYVDLSSPDQVPDKIAVPLPASGKIARYVRLMIPGQKRRIQLREIWVLGGCVEKRCGFGCDELCYCDTGLLSMIRRTQGVCSVTCDRNWRFVNGRCNTSICAEGKMGYECGYDCHCNSTCHPWLGTCLVETEPCSKHYYGTRCQAESVIAESVFTAAGNSTYSSAEETVDGLVDTCGPILAGQAASWTVPLGEQRQVDQILIHVNARTTGYGLEVITETDNGFFQCDTVRQESGARYLARCRNVAATHVRIRTRSTIQICEVAVIECAAGTFGTLCEAMCLCAGGRPCNKTNGICPLGGCLAGYYGDKCDKECIAGTYGPNCESTCGRCKGGAPCDTITGQCPGTCQAGWQGGRCDIECRNGTYGEDCIRNCGWCLDGAPCDKATGDCTDGCHTGYYTRNCSVECVSGRYGYNCNETCGSCKNGLVCDRRDGYCRGGCTLGKMPPLCQTACDHGTFGEGCLQQCGDCRYNTTCDPITGVCHHGCDPGVIVDSAEPTCTTACSDGYFGYNCSLVCPEDLCAGSSVCNKSTGGCLQDCLYPGVQHPLCLHECWDGSFGQHCVHQCGMCQDRAPCNKTTGVCPAGCNPGFTGDKCDITEWSQQLTLGSTVALAFGVSLAVLGLAAVLLAVYFWRRTRKYADSEDYQKSALPDVPVKPPPRNASLVSRVYDNTAATYDTDINGKQGSSGTGSEPLPAGTVTVDNLWDYVHKMVASKADLAQQFSELPVGLVHPCEAAKKAQNLRKNRYKEIFPYDHSRVKLDVQAGEDGNDYVNACYVSGYNQPHMYIAAQGPTEELAVDIWRLIWQQRCSKVIMLTRLVEHGKVKCCQYWPDEGSTQYGRVFVELKATDLYADYNIRTFAVSTEDSADIREVRQYHYEAWPDRQVPHSPASVVTFWTHTRAPVATTPGDTTAAPTLVHCSAGIGRTGTFLALDYLADQAAAEGYVNIQQAVYNLRHQRVNMIQNQDQYVFLHEALVEALLCPGFPVPCEKFALTYRRMLELGTSTREPRLQREFEKLQHVTGYNASVQPDFYDDAAYKAAKSSHNVDKNRDQRILPSEQHRARLTATGFGRSDYINAVFLPTWREEKRYVVSQNPLAGTLVDLWQLVYEHNINTIVTLDKPTDQAEVYWPGAGEVLTLMPFQIHYVTELSHDSHTERTLTLLNTEQPREKSRLIKQFECTFWPGGGDVAPEGGAAPLLGVHEEVLRWQQLSPQLPILVHCLNGADKSGLYCVVTSAVERVKEDREVALVQTLKQMRMRRPQITPTYDQYKFCHDAILEFLKSFDTFSDFYI